ncbi:OprO/OprP family phosphate-selective porin [Colwellia sp. MSW7]|uniref:OprO/OprP family phosphate-selective porin n=1 Tax=Colwellia maritima TaxID=2912588 RepID=A0ABS9X8L1_9GAMM|nr:porin [Colwellia maritima]MCI2285821.1 OprO/OprP family phosphate-selective porin [Colwellia maritima]
MNYTNHLTKLATVAISCIVISPVLLAKNNDVDISGYVMIDHNQFDDTFLENDDDPDKTGIRRARLSFKTNIDENWKTKLQLGFADDSAEIKDAYLRYKGRQWADLTIGQQKEPFGLEKLTSSRNNMMMERSITSEALAPGRSIGANLSGDLSSITWQLGYFQPDETQSSSAVTGRLTWVPWQQNNNLVHLGFAFSERDLNGSEYRINEPLEVNFSDSLIEGTKLFAEDVSLKGVEFLWQQHGFTTTAEWQENKVTDINSEQYQYQGGYLQLSYQFSGENREYKKGEIDDIITPGWEITDRYSQFDLLEENNKVQTYTVGVNYTVNKNLKFMANYVKTKQVDNDSTINGITENGDAVLLRAQYTF